MVMLRSMESSDAEVRRLLTEADLTLSRPGSPLSRSGSGASPAAAFVGNTGIELSLNRNHALVGNVAFNAASRDNDAASLLEEFTLEGARGAGVRSAGLFC